MENERNHRDIKLVTTEGRRNYLFSEANYHTTNFLRKLVIEILKKNRWSRINWSI